MLGGGVYNSSKGINLLIIVVISTVFNTGVSVFILISGYFGIKTSLHKGLRLWITILLCSMINLVVQIGLHKPIGFHTGFLKTLFPVSMKKYWFATSYMLLFLFADYIEKVLDVISRRKFRLLIMILLFVFSIMPTITGYHILEDTGKGPGNMFLMYLIGRYIRKYGLDYSKLKCGIYAVITLSLELMLNIMSTLFYHRYYGIKGAYCPFANDYSIFIVAASIWIFMLFRRININSTLINSLARHVFAIYMLDTVFGILIAHLIDIYAYADNWWFTGIIIVYVLGNMLFGITVDIPLSHVKERLCNEIEPHIRKVINKTSALLEKV